LLGCRAGCLHDQYGCIATALPGKAPDRACLVAGGRSPVCGRTPSRDGSVAQTNSVHGTGTGEGDGCRGAAIRPFPSAIQRSDTVCGAARTVSLSMRRDNLPAQKGSDKQSPSQGGKCRLLQPLLPRTQKRRELSANIRSTCVKQSTHAATVQNVDPTQACAVYKAK